MAPTDESIKMLFTIIRCAGTIDWDEVCEMTGLTKGAVQRRYYRLKKSIETEDGSGTKQPAQKSAGRKRKAANEDAAQPEKRKMKGSSGVLGEKQAEALENEDGAVGEDEEQVLGKDSV